MYTFMKGVHFLCTLSISHYCMLHSLTTFDAYIFLDIWEVWYLRYANHLFYVSEIHILSIG